MLLPLNKPFHLFETLSRRENQPLVSGPLFFGAGAALVLAAMFAMASKIAFAAIAFVTCGVLLFSGILMERRMYLSYEEKYAGSGAEGIASLKENIPYHTLVRGNIESANWKFVIVSPNSRNKEEARFILSEDYFSDAFIKIGHRILPLKDDFPGVKSEPAHGVVHQLDPQAIAAAKPVEQHKRNSIQQI